MNHEGRYEVKLPFRKRHDILHDHFTLCEKRLLKLNSNLKNGAVFLKRYNDIFSEQMELRVIEKIKKTVEPGKCHYIPHQLVVREDKNTSKVRIDFDTSAINAGPNLNECL